MVRRMMQNETQNGLVVQSDRRWAMIENVTVVAVILWDGNTSTFSPSSEVVELDPDSMVGPGWTFDGSLFLPPVATGPAEGEPQPDESET
jgi:hypothetical protein